jgi:phage shock protein A
MSDSNNYNNSNDFNDMNSQMGADFTGDPNLRDETDLRGMDLASAKEYVLSYITTLKQTQRDLGVLSEELALWQKRSEFARERGREDLISAAEMKAKEISEKYVKLEMEEKDLAGKVQTLMENLKKLKAGFTPTVNAEQLAAELDMITGGPDKVAEQFKEEETMVELEKLKQKLKDDGSL